MRCFSLALLLVAASSIHVRADDIGTWQDHKGRDADQILFALGGGRVQFKKGDGTRLPPTSIEDLERSDRDFLLRLFAHLQRSPALTGAKKWRDQTGDYSITAEMVAFSGDQIVLLKAQRFLFVDIDKLDQENQEFLRRLRGSMDTKTEDDPSPVVLDNAKIVWIEGDRVQYRNGDGKLVKPFSFSEFDEGDQQYLRDRHTYLGTRDE